MGLAGVYVYITMCVCGCVQVLRELEQGKEGRKMGGREGDRQEL